jgi:hypothetical protein
MTDTLRIKRRAVGGAAGAPASLTAAEVAYNEQDDTLYYGKGNSGGNATSIVAIAGPGTFALSSAIPVAATVAPLIDGTAAVGVATKYAREDHIHPGQLPVYVPSSVATQGTAVSIAAGPTSGSGVTLGGALSLKGGAAAADGTGGGVTVAGGDTALGPRGGIVYVLGGNTGNVAGAIGGQVVVAGGYGGNGGSTGDLTLVTRDAYGTGGNGGRVFLQAGNTSDAGNPGTVAITAGSCSATTGTNNGGSVTINAGYGGGTTSNGGDIKLTTNAGKGTGRRGVVTISTLPTSDPAVTDALWNNSGVVMLSGATAPWGGGGGIPDAPSDFTTYGRYNGTWKAALPLTGGTITGGLSVTGQIGCGASLGTNSNLFVGNGSATVGAFIDGGPAGQKHLTIYANGSNRWKMLFGAETGSGNGGTNFDLQRYDDGGVYLDSPFYITRSTGVTAFSQIPTHPTPIAGDSSTKSATTAFVGTAIGAALAPGALVMSDTPPASPTPGTQWWDTVSGRLYVWFNDGTSQQWVSASPTLPGTVTPQIMVASWLAGVSPNASILLIASRALTITSIVGVVQALNGAAANVSIYKGTNGSSLSTVVHSGSFDANASLETNQTLPVTVPTMNVGDRLGILTTGTFTSSIGSINVTVA